MNAREELADEVQGYQIGSGYYALDIGHTEAMEIADLILSLGYRKPEVAVKWAAAHAESGLVHNAYRTLHEAQAFVDSMAKVGHSMVIKRCEHTIATHTDWETYEPEQ